ncbi:MarR family transcriptional regulator [Janthinobacterium sp. 17J80-10]|uniref:MarR family winged helix-turn-helix transcriptional regulator n=1 Tax=Janthinobacterium sp. 17J80-10 TaxID=2497863 RepID=UPI0010052881|nr:MarR family transcriptional regulator [Janthinobacterium sp. 17J80-10]QAU35672.1 MarR family transcriptional regulator [Janthinobacterium sp. 17J80-10]
MDSKQKAGLGELLRYVSELVEQGADEHYRAMSLSYRARYTPVLRALNAGAQTVTDITERTHLTQGAISQTIALLDNDGLISRHAVDDGRKSRIQLTAVGRTLVGKLERHWAVTFAAIASLEEEIGYPLRQVLEAAAKALEREGFSDRISAIKAK